MSCPPAESAGLPILAAGMIIACVAMMVTTNRKFGHQTFHNTRSIGVAVGSKNSSRTTTVGVRAERRGSSSNDGNGGSTANGRCVFEGLAEFGVLEATASFLSPADLVGIAPVSTDFCRASASSFLWRCHCERAFGASKPQPPSPADEDWLQAEHKGQGNFSHQPRQEKREEQGWERSGRSHQKRSGGDRAAERRCRCSGGRSGSSQQYRWRPAEGSGQKSGERASPASLFRRSCPDSACGNHSWRERFFRAHRAKPPDLLREAASASVQRPPAPRPCVVILHGRVHDLTEFLPSHPGGSLILHEHAFTDATPAFER